MVYCEDRNGKIINIRAVQGHSDGVTIQSCFYQTDTVELEATHVPHGQLFQLAINPREWPVVRRIESKKHETSLSRVTSKTARIFIETANDRLGQDPMMNPKWCCTSKEIAQTTVLFFTSIYDELTTQSCEFIRVAVTRSILYVNMLASELDKVVVKFCSKGHLSDFN